MSFIMAIDKTTESKWHGSALLGLFGILYLQLRWTNIWQNRWAGFVLGFMFSAALLFQASGQECLPYCDHIPRRIFLLSGIALVLLGAGMMLRFAHNGTGDDAVTAWILIASGTGAAHIFHRLSAGADKNA
jgi:hypothetical protein